jgi:mono/diheme cytochrome c family protein
MLAVVLVLSIFVLLAAGVFFLGLRGTGIRRTSEGRGGRAATNLVLLVVYLGFGVAVPVLLLTGNHSNASAQIGGIQLNQAEKAGRTLFGEHCGVCHTLLAANATGKVGPNLDQLRPPAELVLHTIENGCLQNPPSQSSPEACLGFGNMPANVLQGKNASDVADFVAKVAGHE